MALPRILIKGNLVADPELRFSKAGKAIARLRVASNENRRTESGGWEDGASCFLDVTCFAPLAEPVCEELRKGNQVVVEGRLQQRDYEDSHGAKRTAYEVIADTVAGVIKNKPGGGQRQAYDQSQDPWASAPTHGPGNAPQDDDPPF